MAHDQRYCLECGGRRGPLPHHVAQLIGGIPERGRRVASPARPDAEPLVPERPWLDSWLVAPRAAAAVVLAMLGFGVVAGSLVGGSLADVTGPLVVAVSPALHAAGIASGGGGSGGGSGGGGGGTIVRTVTVGSSGGSGSSGASSGGQSGSSGSGSSGSESTTTSSSTLPPIKHVFLITLSQEGYQQTFGHSNNDPYLAKKLVGKGELLPYYYAVAGGPLANEIALVSGQGPTPETVDDCSVYKKVVPGVTGARGQVLGSGCVYPKGTPTLASQLTAAHKTWKVYVQVKGSGKAAEAAACKHPKMGAADNPKMTAKDPYATWRDPFLYFASLITKTSCAKDSVGLNQLAKDLKSKSTTPAFSYIVADVCHDGSDTPCSPHGQSGMAAADKFLKSVVPEIEHSPAYKSDGLIAITFDEAPKTGPYADSSSCCGNPASYPNLAILGVTGTTTTGTTTTTDTTTDTTTTGPNPPPMTTPTTTGTTTAPTTTGTTTTTTTPTTPTTTSTTPSSACALGGQCNPTGGGGQVGLLLLSKYVKPGLPDVTDYFNHFSLLASIEQLFGLKRLGYASGRALPVFGAAVWDNYSG